MQTTAPKHFLIQKMFTHQSPDIVRAVLQDYGFTVKTVQNTKDSEIWTKPDADAFWIVRMDSQGHKTRFHHGSRPHYHKNWVASAEDLRKYLKAYFPGAMVYSDKGDLLGTAEQCQKSDRMAAAQHIKR